MVKTKAGRTQLRMVIDAGETVQAEAVLKAATFPSLGKGRRTLRLTLPAGEKVTAATLKLTITDGFGNRKTVRRRIQSRTG